MGRTSSTNGWILGASLTCSSLLGCAQIENEDDREAELGEQQQAVEDSSQSKTKKPTKKQIEHGRDLWIKETFGGEKFFSLVMPLPPFQLVLGLDVMLQSPRASRFTEWGVVNDPDCQPGDASTHGFDKCKDPNSAGVVGVRKFPNPAFNASLPTSPTNTPVLLGVACAGCHAGLDPQNPPKNPNAPGWDNIHLTTGNQYDQIGKIFGAHQVASSPRYQVFNSWAPGTVDTTAIENDGINNPGTITQFYEFDKRPFFDHHLLGQPKKTHRAGQGGEDDVGCELATTRVFFNIGMCASECMVSHLGGGQSPIDLAQCERDCADYRREQENVGDLCAFILDAKSTPTPTLDKAPGGKQFIDKKAQKRGADVFAQNCASCHSNGENQNKNSWTNDLPLVAASFDAVNGEAPGTVGTHKCRALSTNWLGGKIWAAFSSDELKARGPGYYKNLPLLGVWATAPFLHNNRLGLFNNDPSVPGRIAAFENAFDLLLNPSTRDFNGSIQRASVAVTLPSGGTVPAGTPINAFANVNPATGVNACPEYVENGGHYYGAALSADDKRALREYVKSL